MNSLLENDRQNLHSRLLDAVRACQTQLGGKNEMVTEASSWVSCLCTQFEAVLQHRLKSSSKSYSISVIKQTPIAEESTFWMFVRNHLTKHEIESYHSISTREDICVLHNCRLRFESLSNISCDLGRGRAWIRSSLNEHSLDRYFRILLSDMILLRTYYESDAFMLDEEKTSTLPQMAAGLASIFFNIKFNDAALNGSVKPLHPQSSGFIPNLINATANVIPQNLIGSSNVLKEDKPRSESVLEARLVSTEKPKKRTGKKKRTNIISFGDDDDGLNGQGSVTPAVKGGPGYVVIKPQNKVTGSYTSDSSSGVYSNEGQTLNRDLKPTTEDYERSTTPDQVEPAETRKQTTTLEEKVLSRPTSIDIHSGDYDTAASTDQLASCTILSKENSESGKEQSTSIKLESNVKSDENGLKCDEEDPENLGEVTRHLMSVRHRSALGSHDLVMDDWSIRSSSVISGNTPVIDGGVLGEFHPMQEECETQSTDSRGEAYAQNESTSSASLVLSLAHKSTVDWKKNSVDSSILDNMDENAMDPDEMKQALVALMHRRTELSEANQSMRTLLDSEMEHSASLRRQIERLKEDLNRQKDEVTSQQRQHMRENEVLRNQLMKYVGAVQALQRGDSNVEMPGDLPKLSSQPPADASESEVYEQKLIEVAEMHGELMEFNERLHVRLQSALALLRNMKTELVDLRGPMPNDDLISRIENDNISGTTECSPPLSRALINIWIPSAFLKGKGANTHHVFQVYVRIGDEEWNVYRRYSQFHELHLQLRKKYFVLDSYGFPPKKVMGNKGQRFVEDRRKGLQLYLRMVMNNVVQNHEKVVAKPSKRTLTSLLPFFSENLDIPDQTPDKKQRKSRRQR